MVDFILFQGSGLHQAIPWKCHFTFLHTFGLPFTRGHGYLLGSRFKVNHHWGCGLGPYFGGVCSLCFSSYFMSRAYRPPTQSRFRKRLAELLGLKMLVVDVLTRYGSGFRGSIPFYFLLCRFGEAECPTIYHGDFVDLEEHWTFYRR